MRNFTPYIKLSKRKKREPDGEPKPDYYAFMAMDTDKEEEYVAKAKARIGEDLFDYLLAPEITDVPEEDDSLKNSILTNSN